MLLLFISQSSFYFFFFVCVLCDQDTKFFAWGASPFFPPYVLLYNTQVHRGEEEKQLFQV